ncbi:unnamed protein product, partial [Polarella glacialis]
ESEEDTDDEVDIPLAPPGAIRKQRTSVSAEAFGEWNQRVLFEPPVYPKSPEQMQELCDVVSKSFLFNSLELKDLEVVLMAMKGPLVIEPGYRLIQEGDSGDHLYVVTDGAMDCVKVFDGVEMVVKTCVKGDLFGELALMYNCPRGASVQCREESTLWELERGTFNNVVMEAVQRKRAQCMSALRRVPLFANMSQGELESIIDALKMERYPEGSLIIQQGDVGEHFFIVYEGQVLASKYSPDAEPMTMLHEAGDYFGELALLHGEPRAASVSAYTEACLLSMDRATFKRLMGSVETYLESHTDRYE